MPTALSRAVFLLLCRKKKSRQQAALSERYVVMKKNVFLCNAVDGYG